MSDGTFRVEEFLEAITSQLDRTQDALALKAVNRPLTYAIKDFALELKVYVEMDPDGQVIFRSSGPDEAGSSTVSIAFTTITRPMIQENTIGLEEVQSPSLDELGLAPDEARQLEKVGVRNAAQLKRLHTSSGEGAVARFANLPVNRIREAMRASRPRVDRVSTDDGHVGPSGSGRAPSVRVPPSARRLHLAGANLGWPGPSSASLDGMPVEVAAEADGQLTVELGSLAPRGRLEVEAGGEVLSFDLDLDDGADPNGQHAASRTRDPWSPS